MCPSFFVILAFGFLTSLKFQEMNSLNMIFKVKLNQDESSEQFNEESLHLNELNNICMQSHQRGTPIIPWNCVDDKNKFDLIYRDDSLLYKKLSDCPAIDIYIPKGILLF